jgi:hypothetical protein
MDDDLAPSKTEGFKVGEKKTIDEYKNLGALALPCCGVLRRRRDGMQGRRLSGVGIQVLDPCVSLAEQPPPGCPVLFIPKCYLSGSGDHIYSMASAAVSTLPFPCLAL